MLKKLYGRDFGVLTLVLRVSSGHCVAWEWAWTAVSGVAVALGPPALAVARGAVRLAPPVGALEQCQPLEATQAQEKSRAQEARRAAGLAQILGSRR